MPSPYENFPQDLAQAQALEKELDLAIQKAEETGILLRNKTKGRMFGKINMVARKAGLEKISPSDFRRILDSYLGLLSHRNAHNLKGKIRNDFIFQKLEDL